MIKSELELRKIYEPASGRAANKEMSSLEKHSRHFINLCPFLTMGTVNKNGKLDVSPRGGEPGFVKILDDKTLIIPDSKGNNRLDGIVNIIETNQIGMLLLIPGVDETLRINGKAEITNDIDILKQFDHLLNPPKTCYIIHIEEVFMHCAKAIMRSNLWSEESNIKRSDFPTMGEILKDQIGSSETAESREDMVKRYRKDL